ncbi:MAG: DUF1566 domain-containing protein, partial [Campylobacterota bacterium]|nr:DUF1566 domain-containing protein [Campylobacterota bacterium]
GYSNWRLPSAQELMELSDKSKVNPSIDAAFSYPSSGIFWSSTSYSFESDKAWSVNFAYGSNRWESKDGEHFVRCVHDDPFATTGYVEEYYKESNIVTHAKSALQWQDELYSSDEQSAYTTGSSIGKVESFEEAINYCETLSLDGYSDWRLPNFNELYLLVDRSKNSPAINDAFANKPQGHYWSSTTVSWEVNNAWVINFQYGNPETKDKTQVAYVRCVRN